MKKRTAAFLFVAPAIVLAMLIAVQLIPTFFEEAKTLEPLPACPGVWKPMCGQYEADQGAAFAGQEAGKTCCAGIKPCPGLWRDVVVCMSEAKGTSMGREFSDAEQNKGHVCCSN